MPRIQSSAEPEALHPQANLQDSVVKYGEGGQHHPGTRRLAHKKVTKAPTPVTPLGGYYQRKHHDQPTGRNTHGGHYPLAGKTPQSTRSKKR